MKKFNYYLAMSLLCSATFVGTLSSCNKDDDNDNNSSTDQTVTGAKPIKDTDFKVSVEENTVTVTSNLNYGNQWVTFEGVQYNLKDGKVEITQPVAGTYKAIFSYYDNGKTISSDEFDITIEVSDLTFLDEGVFKLLSGGKAAYEEAVKTADANGVFTRTWRLDGFVNATNDAYSKVFYGPGTYCRESANECYNGGVSANGNGNWRELGKPENATISFDIVNKKVKVVYTEGFKLQETSIPNAVNKEEKITGTYYGTFTYNETEGNTEFLAVIDGWAKTTTEINGLEIVLNGENVRIPFMSGALAWPLSASKDVTNVKLFASKSTEEEDGLMILSAVSYNTNDAKDGLKDDYCNIMMNYVAEELESTYSYEIPDEWIWNGKNSFDAGLYDNTWATTGTWNAKINGELTSTEVTLENGDITIVFSLPENEDGTAGTVTAANTFYFDLMNASQDEQKDVAVAIKSITVDGTDYTFDATTATNTWNADKTHQFRTQIALPTPIAFTNNVTIVVTVSGL
ncbi:MAG: hypothetical protein II937_17035 [Bacteroidales bacterium]|nr:hypothetical protein [Bacteroidales bacterium]